PHDQRAEREQRQADEGEEVERLLREPRKQEHRCEVDGALRVARRPVLARAERPCAVPDLDLADPRAALLEDCRDEAMLVAADLEVDDAPAAIRLEAAVR